MAAITLDRGGPLYRDVIDHLDGHGVFAQT
jgi:hypothetical protein